MLSHKDEFHHCPACASRTRHRISSDRKLATVLWCQSCFHVHMEVTEEQPPLQQRAA